jgi:hypothetical protein
VAEASDSKTLDKVVLLLVSGLSDQAARDACVERLGHDAESASEVVAEARRRITIAADYKRDEQVGTAFFRLNDLYARSLKVQDVKTALAAQKELNKLLGLYPAAAQPDAEPGGDGEAVRELAAVRAHLAGLDLGQPNTTTEELARLAASRLIAFGGDHEPT